MSDQPSKKWVDNYVRAAALNSYANRHNAPLSAQQRLYDKFIRLRLTGEEKWPLVDFDKGLASAVEIWLKTHPLRGPGVDW